MKKWPKWFKFRFSISQRVGLSRGREWVVYWCMLLFIPPLSLWFFCTFFLFLYSFFLSILSFLSFYVSFLLFVPLSSFTIPSYPFLYHLPLWDLPFFAPQLLLAPYGCSSKTAHWLADSARNVLVAPLSILRQNCLSCFLPLSIFHFTHLDKN